MRAEHLVTVRSRMRHIVMIAFAIAVTSPAQMEAASSRASATVAVSIARVHVAQSRRPELPNDFERPSPRIRQFGDLQLMLQSSPSASDSPSGVYDVTVYTAAWCGPCESAKRRDGTGNVRIRLTWVQQAPPSGIPESYPTYCWRDRTGSLRYVQGARTLDRLLTVIERNDPPEHQPSQIAASAVGGSLKTSGRIRQMLSTWSDRLGSDAKLSLRIDRNGLQSLSVTRLLHGQPWTATQVCGTFGHVSISTTSTRLPGGLQELGFTYRVLDSGRFSLDADPLVVTLPIETNETSPNLLARLAMGEDSDSSTFLGPQPSTLRPSGIDPVTVGLTIAQLASALYQILNPQIDIGLGGALALDAELDGPDKLIISFTDCPSIHVAAWFRFDLEVQRIEISPGNVHVAFKPQPRNWIHVDSRDFPVDDN